MRTLLNIVGLLVLVVGAAPVFAKAGPSPADEQREAEIVAEVRLVSAAAGDRFVAANAARTAEKHDEAARLYAEVESLAPLSSHAFRRHANEEVLLHHAAEAEALARQSVALGKQSIDYAGLAMVLSATKGGEAVSMARKATQLDPQSEYAFQTLCMAALSARDQSALDDCARNLRRLGPDSIGTHYFSAISFGTHDELDKAEAELSAAERAGLATVEANELRAQLRAAQPLTVRLGPTLLWGGVSWLALLFTLFLLGGILSFATMRAARRLPTRGHTDVAVSRGLRRIYRAVIALSCVSYWVSMPIIASLVLIVGGGIVYALLAVGHVPIKLLLLVVVVVLVTLWAILKSLFIRVGDAEPGHRLNLAEHPRLRAVLDEVAAQVGTRTVDAVFITPGTELAVLERGGTWKQLTGKSQRCLVLGLGVLPGFRLPAFRAVLAHEYGHFSNRDTAGGHFALIVRRSLMTMALTMAKNGAAAFYNPAWWFVSGFYRVFLRISQGASRLQEIEADRVAARLFGAAAFKEGLLHAIEADARFESAVQGVLRGFVEQDVPLTNLYRQIAEHAVDETEVHGNVALAMAQPASAYDSHPAPADRIALVEALQAALGIEPVERDDDDLYAWTLFDDRDALELRLTATVRSVVTGVAQDAAA